MAGLACELDSLGEVQHREFVVRLACSVFRETRAVVQRQRLRSFSFTWSEEQDSVVRVHVRARSVNVPLPCVRHPGVCSCARLPRVRRTAQCAARATRGAAAGADESACHGAESAKGALRSRGHEDTRTRGHV